MHENKIVNPIIPSDSFTDTGCEPHVRDKFVTTPPLYPATDVANGSFAFECVTAQITGCTDTSFEVHVHTGNIGTATDIRAIIDSVGYFRRLTSSCGARYYLIDTAIGVHKTAFS